MDKFKYLHSFELIKFGAGCDMSIGEAIRYASIQYLNEHEIQYSEFPHLELDCILLGSSFTPNIDYVEYKFNVRVAHKDTDLLKVKLAQCNEVLRGGK